MIQRKQTRALSNFKFVSVDSIAIEEAMVVNRSNIHGRIFFVTGRSKGAEAPARRKTT